MADGKITSRRINFTMIGNTAITDQELSPRALGIYVKMYYYTSIPGFTLYKSKMRELVGMGREAFQKDWNELINRGYLKVTKHNGARGRFVYEYEVLAIPEPKEENAPDTEKPHMDTPDTDLPHMANTTPNNTINNNTTREIHRDAEMVEASEYGKSIIDELIPSEVLEDESFNEWSIDSVFKKSGKKLQGGAIRGILEEAKRRYTNQAESQTIGSPWSYYIRVLKSTIKQWDSVQKKKNGTKKTKSTASTGNRFHNFHQREYTHEQMQDMELQLLANQW